MRPGFGDPAALLDRYGDTIRRATARIQTRDERYVVTEQLEDTIARAHHIRIEEEEVRSTQL